MAKKKAPTPVLGWREWVSLPELGILAIKPKIDTGAASSSIHAMHLKTFHRDGATWVRFDVHPEQRSSRVTVRVEAPVHEFRMVRSSSGHAAKRPVIVTPVEIAGQRWPIELTLANRDQMGFRMLLGRQALRGRFLVDAGRSYVASKEAEAQRRKNRPARGPAPPSPGVDA